MFKFYLNLILIPLLLAFFATTQAQQYNFRTYSVDHGLPQSQIIAMVQDNEGFIWFATQGAGLCRFDGTSFTYFSQEHGIPHTQIWNMICDTKGQIWVATEGGIARFNGKTFDRFALEEEIEEESVWSIFEDSRGQIWIGLPNEGVFRLDGNVFKRIRSTTGLPFDDGNCIMEDSRGNIWVGSFGYGLARFDGVEYHHYTSDDVLVGNYVTCVLEVANDEVWVGTEAGINVYDGKTIKPLENAWLADQSVEDMMLDKDGNVWIATYDNGVFKWNEHDPRHFTKDNGLPTNYLYSLMQDNVGNIWVGTNGGGVSKFEGEMFTHTTIADGLTGNVVMGIMQDSHGNFWFATEEGLTKKSGDNYEYFTKDNGLPSNDLYYVYEDRHGAIWVSTFVGVSKIQDGQIITFGEPEGFTYSTATTFFEDEFGQLWAGADDGVYIYKEGRFALYNPDSLLSAGVNRVYADSKGSMWFCTTEGVVNIQVDKAITYTTQDGLPSMDITDIWEDPTGKFWFLTDRGLAILSKGRFYTITTKNGLASDNLYCMVFDGNDLWVGSEKGIDRIYFDEYFEMDSTVKHYGKSEGFKGVECNGWAAYMDVHGYLWFGTIAGATRYNKRHDNPSIVPPLVKLTSLRLFYEEVDWKEKCVNEIENYRDVPANPCLTYNDNHLTFDFIGLDFTTPEDVRYKFMLVGFDEEWQPETDQSTVTYSNLPPGDFTFKVIARNADGVWSNAVTYSFVIESPFWMRTWFYVISIPLGLGLFYLIILMRTRRIARSKRQLEEVVRLRTRDLRHQKREVEKLSIVASQTEDGIIIANAKGELTWMNQSMMRITGMNLDKFKQTFGTTVAEVSDFEDIKNFLKRINTKKESAHYDVIAPKMEGYKEEDSWLSAALTPAYDEEGNLINIVMVYTDITERKKAEDQLIKVNKDITDSIQYASQIQTAIMPNQEILKRNFPESFVLFRPRDIVSGDFYWFTRIGPVFVLCAVDCTGHGVPGAFMSMIGNEFLHQIVNNGTITGPEQALGELDGMIKRALGKTGAEKDAKDGMDMGMCAIHTESLFCQYAGAFNPMYVIRDGELIEYAANKTSVGSIPDDGMELIGHEFTLKENDTLYLFTDGYIDQFGGERGKKYMRGRFKEFLLSIQDKSMDEQYKLLEHELDNWKGDRDQLDDILVISLRVVNYNKHEQSTKRIVEQN